MCGAAPRPLSHLVPQIVQRSSFHAWLRRCVQYVVLGAQSRRWPQMRTCRAQGYFPTWSLVFTLSCSHQPVYDQGGKEVHNFFAVWSATLSQALEKNKLEGYEILRFLKIATLSLVLQPLLFMNQNLTELLVICTIGRTLCYMVPL